MNSRTIKVRDFTKIPGPRYKISGQNSAEEFCEKFVAPIIRDQSVEHITIDFSGTWGYPPSFTSQLGIYLKDELGSYEAVKKLVSTFASDNEVVENQFWLQLEEESTS